ncbi:hypothetical protein OAN307_c29995 [Octadecabacter antarcticus 307]|uniref:DUF7210 domain-containing protein n=1 Tax=Octadecabacter antarcticus 307 TaxID=391626 RepID=M9RFG1_9RHOB|nr:hypothetical protein [Octadecabacter antarcticus]AGI68550.1 hypothetical protein OAN307_c29995 [Octadecabacter antarcticus 307]
MAKKLTKPQRIPAKPRGKRAPERTDKASPSEHADSKNLQKRIMQHLADTPALLATSVLSEMLRDTTDQPTRIAIQYSRIEVLRARTISCRLGKPADRSVKPSSLLSRNTIVSKTNDAQTGSLVEERPAHDSHQAETADAAVPESILIQLTVAHLHQGVELPKGTTFKVSSIVGAELIKINVAKHAPKEKPASSNTKDTAELKKGST